MFKSPFKKSLVEMLLYMVVIIVSSIIFQLIFDEPELGGYQKPLIVSIILGQTIKHFLIPTMFEKLYEEKKKKKKKMNLNLPPV